MAIFHFKCPKCSKERRWRRKEAPYCEYCGELMKRNASPPSTTVKETLDNGVMARAVERIVNQPEMTTDRAKNDPRNNR